MRVAEHYNLGLGQAELDFINVDVYGDDLLYVDPRALRLSTAPWARDCVSLIQDFFDTVLDAIRSGKDGQARTLLAQLREPNETHLGMSIDRARGQALGPGSAVKVWEQLKESEAVRSGLIEDLEETALMVEGIAFDKVSDIATNIIRQPLIAYTQAMCELYGIPMEQQSSGPLWDPSAKNWFNEYVELPSANGSKLLLVPKVIVRRKLHYNADDYFNHYVLEWMQSDEIDARTELVRTLKDGSLRVSKRDLVEKYGAGKRVSVRVTKKHPELLEAYRETRGATPATPLSHEELLEKQGQPPPDWDALVKAVVDTPVGDAGADRYHRAVQALLTALFGPYLTYPEREFKLHDGRKRVDITYSNAAHEGFFRWLSLNYPAMLVMVECKNYGRDVANPELDQLAGRFGPNRGKFGILACRSFSDKQRFIERCRDTARDDRGFIIPLDDDDLTELVTRRKNEDFERMWDFLRERFNFLLT